MRPRAPELQAELEDPVYARANPDGVADALRRLGCLPHPAFQEFYQRYAGPFSSEHNGFLLLDLVDDHPTVITQTEVARTKFDFPERYLVLSDLLGHAVIVYDSQTDAVHEVDFEGGESALKSGTLAPTWPTFEHFLEAYFLGQ